MSVCVCTWCVVKWCVMFVNRDVLVSRMCLLCLHYNVLEGVVPRLSNVNTTQRLFYIIITHYNAVTTQHIRKKHKTRRSY